MPIYEDKSFKDYVNGLPAADEKDLNSSNENILKTYQGLKKIDSSLALSKIGKDVYLIGENEVSFYPYVISKETTIEFSVDVSQLPEGSSIVIESWVSKTYYSRDVAVLSGAKTSARVYFDGTRPYIRFRFVGLDNLNGITLTSIQNVSLDIKDLNKEIEETKLKTRFLLEESAKKGNFDISLYNVNIQKGALNGSGNIVSDDSSIVVSGLKLKEGSYTFVVGYGCSIAVFVNGSLKANGNAIESFILDQESSVKFTIRNLNGESISDVNEFFNNSEFAINPDKAIKVYSNVSQGSFSGSGADNSSANYVRTGKISTDEKYIYLIRVPQGYKSFVNRNDCVARGETQYNSTRSFKSGISLVSPIKNSFFRIAYGHEDGTATTASTMTDADKMGFYIYLVPKKGRNEIVVAASDSSEQDKNVANVVCDGSNDTEILNCLFSASTDVNIRMMAGNYNLNKIHQSSYSDVYCFIQFADDVFAATGNLSNYQRSISVIGNVACKYGTGVNFVISQNAYDSLVNGVENACILCPRLDVSKTTSRESKYTIFIKDIGIVSPNYTKDIVYFDFCAASSIMADGLRVHSNGGSGLRVFETTPAEVVGIRVGYGSNVGIQQYVKRSSFMMCKKGVSCCGEHFIFEDVLAHHCIYGFCFGDRETKGYFEHPNVMIGCSVEGSKYIGLLTKQNDKNEGDFVQNGSTNHTRSTLVCIGLSVESKFETPTDLGGGQVNTLGWYEVLNGAYRGTIQMDGNDLTKAFSLGGKNIDWTLYSYTKEIKGRGQEIVSNISY